LRGKELYKHKEKIEEEEELKNWRIEEELKKKNWRIGEEGGEESQGVGLGSGIWVNWKKKRLRKLRNEGDGVDRR
jgi:hypothetical protein